MRKACSRCKELKPLEEFGVRLERPDGRKYTCRVCESEKQIARYKRNPEHYNAVNRALGIVPKSRFSRFKKRCVFTDKTFSLTFEEWSALVLDKSCHYCYGPLETKGCALDRKDNSIGYHLDNVVPCCKECNRLKGPTLTYAEMNAVSALLRGLRK